jgi:hypothetical protein
MSNVINNVTFCYIKIQNPVLKYQSSDSEYTVDCVVSKADSKEWNKAFPKQKAKVVENEEFTEKFKIDLPFPEQEEQFVIKMKKPHVKNGKELDQKYRPRVFLQGEDGVVTDITFDMLPANGSKGKAAYQIRTNDFGTFAQLDSILIEDLIEYRSNGVGSAFGVKSLADAPEAKVVTKQTDTNAAGSNVDDEDDVPEPTVATAVAAKPKAPAKPSKAVVEASVEEDDEDPFAV